MVFLKLAKGQQDATLHLWQALVGVLLATGALRPDVLRAMLVYCADHVPTESPSQGILIRARQDLDAALGRDGEGGVEHIDAVAFSWDVELIVFAEEIGLRAAELEETIPTGR